MGVTSSYSSKKGGKWQVCVDYRELNLEKMKDHFPLPFVDQVLDSLVGKKYFSFFDRFSGYNQIIIAPKIRKRPNSCALGEDMLTLFFPLGYAMLQLLSKELSLAYSQTFQMTAWRYTWIILLLMVHNLMKNCRIYYRDVKIKVCPCIVRNVS